MYNGSFFARECRSLTGETGPLRFRAGPGAYHEIRQRGFAEERIGTIAGASGGAKWLVLSQLDRVITERVLPKLAGPVHLLGSSIGAWRFACYAQSAPLAALERFEAAYVEQRYSARPTAAEVSGKTREILAHVLGESGTAEIISHAHFRSHILTVRSRLLTSSDYRPALWSGLFAAALANSVSRRTLGAFFTRSLFYDPRDLPPFYNATGFPLERIALTADNLVDAVIASGSIPTVLTGVRDIPGAPAGVYRDGGIIDYHLDLPLGEPDRLTLFPHFFDRLIPGWFDKGLRWRRHDPLHTDRTLLISPSAEFISRLPGGKVPDRTDFVRLTEPQRIDVWQRAIAACRELADDLNDVLDGDRLAARLEPL